MYIAKDGVRSIVRVGYDGRVYKTFRGTDADKRYENEKVVLKVLEERGCDFVPRMLECEDETMTLVTTNCGHPVEKMSDQKMESLYEELKQDFGVIHEDPFLRNITYHSELGRFCIIDFELASILERTEPSNQLQVSWSGLTHDGTKKPGNEDALSVFSPRAGQAEKLALCGDHNLGDEGIVFAVSDGMGGVKGGEIASQLAVWELNRFVPAKMGDIHHNANPAGVLGEAVMSLHEYINRQGRSRDLEGMGATLVCGLLFGRTIQIAHVGDSRIYHFHEGELKQLTFDHSYVGKLFREGQINERQARNHPKRNVLSQVLGAGDFEIEPQVDSFQLTPGDWLLFCSDGVIDGLWDKNIHEFFSTGADAPASEVAEKMLKEAIDVSGTDDTTLIVAKVTASNQLNQN